MCLTSSPNNRTNNKLWSRTCKNGDFSYPPVTSFIRLRNNNDIDNFAWLLNLNNIFTAYFIYDNKNSNLFTNPDVNQYLSIFSLNNNFNAYPKINQVIDTITKGEYILTISYSCLDNTINTYNMNVIINDQLIGTINDNDITKGIISKFTNSFTIETQQTINLVIELMHYKKFSSIGVYIISVSLKQVIK